MVGRIDAGPSLVCVAEALVAARGRLASSRPTVGCDPPPEAAASAEECWWLLGFAGHLLADEAKGEAPLVPEALRTVSHAAARTVPSGAGFAALASADPVIRASSEALQLCQDEASGAGQSPLLTAQVCVDVWGGKPWSGRYLCTCLCFCMVLACA